MRQGGARSTQGDTALGAGTQTYSLFEGAAGRTAPPGGAYQDSLSVPLCRTYRLQITLTDSMQQIREC